MKIFNSEQIRNIDYCTINNSSISSYALMETAAKVFFAEFISNIDNTASIIVIAGPGNNGGDALALSRMLLGAGYSLKVILCNPNNKLSVDCATNKQRLIALTNIYNLQFVEASQDFVCHLDFAELQSKHTVVIDGLFGTGLNREIADDFAELIKLINNSSAHVVTIDVPSGLFIDEELLDKNADKLIICARQTFTFQFAKLPFMLPDCADFIGEWKVLDIGLDKDVIAKLSTPYHYLNKEDVSCLMQKRQKFAHKGNFGHAALIAGSTGKFGAAILAAKSCMRSGVGLLTSHVPASAATAMQVAIPESMLDIDNNANYFSAIDNIDRYDAIGIGCGLGVNPDSGVAFFALLKSVKVPMVIDADALNLLALANKINVKTNQIANSKIKLIPKGSILTPHVGELSRLLAIPASASSYYRLRTAIDFAQQFEIIVILKGANSAICLPDGSCYFNSTGNSGMATAGCGDVLTGLLLGLLAQGYAPESAAILGVYLHGLAGDIVAQLGAEQSIIASDIIEHFADSFKLLSSN